MTKPSWEGFAATLGELTTVDATSIGREARLIEDLDIDSLGLIELVVAMVNEYSLAIPNGLDARQWEGLTAGQLFDAVSAGALP